MYYKWVASIILLKKYFKNHFSDGRKLLSKENVNQVQKVAAGRPINYGG